MLQCNSLLCIDSMTRIANLPTSSISFCLLLQLSALSKMNCAVQRWCSRFLKVCFEHGLVLTSDPGCFPSTLRHNCWLHVHCTSWSTSFISRLYRIARLSLCAWLFLWRNFSLYSYSAVRGRRVLLQARRVRLGRREHPRLSNIHEEGEVWVWAWVFDVGEKRKRLWESLRFATLHKRGIVV